ncbi:SDR family oxidoreductase [Vineibacter terrae]|uniref:SDR family NAD(P)-dependent oxidoreductase n=1 Tax=Vineibacter terrae TaxID=2586908 RepID=UPI002E2F6623|nr:SDR family oxidoreductase [Vineibacter terrae]HEX2887349.1 SDR family oxidoreductase [Vineibacter terrae]
MASPLFDLTGKVAIVTGSSKGIGKSIAEQLALQGAKVVISSRKLPNCEAVAEGIRKQGGEAIAVGCNISEKAQLEKLVAETRKAFGPIDIVVCNAASNPYYGPTEKMPDEAFTKIMQNNILSNVWLITMCLPDMRAKKDGAVIIVSSIGGLRGTAVLGAYGISKAADMALTRNLAIELGPDNIRVNTIAPGLVKTDFARALWENPEYLNKRLQTAPLRRIGEPDDIGGIAVMLASKAGAFITGQTIVADAGVTIA